ncbi:MAG: hypothetical protein ABIY55_01785 [Kofleriaceae bacterium]
MKRLCTIVISISTLALSACGDNGGGSPDATPPIEAPATSRVVIVAGDFTPGDPGVLTTLDAQSREVHANAGPALAIGSDPILRHVDHELLVVNRGENNVTILDDDTLAFKAQLGTGANSNPQDVAVVGTKLYVPTYATSGVTVLTRGSNTTTLIDLSVDDPDGKPDCNSVFAIGTDVYVSCELLQGFDARGPGKVYVIDATTDTVQTSKTITLLHKNPFGLFEQLPPGAPNAGDLVIPTVEDFATAPGCIERITPGATTSTCLLDNALLGGYASRIAFEVRTGAAVMWSAVAVTDFVHANLRGYDLPTTTLAPAPLSPAGEKVVDVVACPSGQVVVVDSTQNASGLRVYDGAVEQTTAALPIGISSFSQHGLVCY